MGYWCGNVVSKWWKTIWYILKNYKLNNFTIVNVLFYLFLINVMYTGILWGDAER